MYPSGTVSAGGRATVTVSASSRPSATGYPTVARLAPAFVWWMHPRVGLRMEIAPGVNLHPKNYQVYDRIKGKEDRRPLAEVGWFHTTFGVGLDVRLGRRAGR